ncbi:hypothetical protein DVV81_08125 [Clostridium botulinum]|uniref:hypothetical protein n=1 Tax=Clostridium botulinum TaxID=1491 RepID=UPI00196778DA|nr:hypothetical protein [Clostridium botulinum]MBN1071135.1 hypothetical protein [Clostridium botulinum]
MSYDYISEEDKQLMYSLCMNDKKITYEGIARLFQSKYSNITESIVGIIVREKNEKNEPIINFNSKLNPIMKRVKSDLQANRRTK